jgi:ABC-type oligopeptide transport system ATPase subunit
MEINAEKTKVMRISRQPSPAQIMKDKKQYFNSLGNLIIHDASCTREIKSRIAIAKTAFNKTTLLINR